MPQKPQRIDDKSEGGGGEEEKEPGYVENGWKKKEQHEYLSFII